MKIFSQQVYKLQKSCLWTNNKTDKTYFRQYFHVHAWNLYCLTLSSNLIVRVDTVLLPIVLGYWKSSFSYFRLGNCFSI